MTAFPSTQSQDLVQEYRSRAPGLNLLLCEVVDRLRSRLASTAAGQPYTIDGELATAESLRSALAHCDSHEVERSSLWSNGKLVSVRLRADSPVSADALTELIAGEFAVERVERHAHRCRLLCRWVESSSLVLRLPEEFRFEIEVIGSSAKPRASSESRARSKQPTLVRTLHYDGLRHFANS